MVVNTEKSLFFKQSRRWTICWAQKSKW